MAILPVSDLLPRPHEHRQRKSRRPPRRPEDDQRPIQRESHNFLRQLFGVRAIDKYPIKEVEAQRVFAHHHDLVGNLHDVYGPGA